MGGILARTFHQCLCFFWKFPKAKGLSHWVVPGDESYRVWGDYFWEKKITKFFRKFKGFKKYQKSFSKKPDPLLALGKF